MDCTHAARPDWLRITDATESLNCPDFSSLLADVEPALVWRLLRTAPLTAILGGGVFAWSGYEAA
jgi:hypothetical protein